MTKMFTAPCSISGYFWHDMPVPLAPAQETLSGRGRARVTVERTTYPSGEAAWYIEHLTYVVR